MSREEQETERKRQQVSPLDAAEVSHAPSAAHFGAYRESTA